MITCRDFLELKEYCNDCNELYKKCCISNIFFREIKEFGIKDTYDSLIRSKWKLGVNHYVNILEKIVKNYFPELTTKLNIIKLLK